jgi:hypothetical protein
MHRVTVVLLALALLAGSVIPLSAAATDITTRATPAAPAPAPHPLATGDITIQDTPTALVGSGVTSYALAAPKVFWHTDTVVCPPGLASQPAGPSPYTETISRIATYGSPVRQLFAEGRNCGIRLVNSNIAADADYVYFLTSTGLQRLSTNANPGDPPQMVNALVAGYGELADGGDRTYYIVRSGNNSYIGYVLKSNNQRVQLTALGSAAYNLSTDGEFIYYLVSGNLNRLKPGVDSGVPIVTAVSGYFAEGQRLSCLLNPPVCFYSKNVYVGKGNRVYIYNNNNNTLGASPIYTSADPTAAVTGMVTDSSKLFLIEQRSCGTFCSTYVLIRTPRSGGQVDVLRSTSASMTHLTTNGDFLFWQDGSCCVISQTEGSIQRLPKDATALPQINMRVTGIEVTQGIQNLSNSVPLIKNRRTFVRLYVRSDGASVAGVSAQLSAPALGFGAWVMPVNPVGTTITVRNSPSRNDINQSFLFELPWNWTNRSSLTLQAELNLYKVPLEPNYADNSTSISLTFNNSPSLSVQFFRLNYTIGGTTYRPRITDDVLKTYSWILRAYPIGGTVGQNFKPTLWDVDGSTQLGRWVNRASSDCTASKIGDSDLDLCASYYTNGWLKYYRDHGWVPDTNSFYYGMISDASNNFPRGQALYTKTSVGPAGTPGQFFSLGQGWDTDGSYADWYAGHEIGHSLGRAHPSSGNSCGHSASDPSYPYPNAQIGPNDGSMEGFDRGDPSFGIAKAVLPGTVWHDMMSYCSNQWISDYTYNGIYSYMIAHPSAAPTLASTEQSIAPAVSGDFLAVAGVINTAANTAGFSLVRRLTSAANQPPLTPGGYIIRLLNAQNGTLVDYPFTPQQSAESQLLGFDQVVNFVAGTRKVQIVKQNGGQVLASQPISANPPTIGNVALQGAPSPVSGVVTLGWSASDADGDPLTFDIFYSRNNGATFQPVKMGATGASTPIDTAQLGGSGTAILRVVASDGVHSAEASSAPFVMASKPPQPYILTPGDATHIHYGQLVNFSGMAFDAQDGTVGAGGLIWKNAQGTIIGGGPLLSLTDLLVGTNHIALIATNSAGLSANTSITVIVDDDLSLPGPTLTAGPGQVSWHVAAGATQAQTAQISIGNAGSMTLNWTASSDQPWLTLNAASGSVGDGDPSTLMLTANPAGMASGTTHSATLTLTKPAAGGDPAQTILIPVSLSVGDVWNNVEPVGGNKVYLPLVVR